MPPLDAPGPPTPRGDQRHILAAYLLLAVSPIEKGRMGANADADVGICHAAAARASSTCVAAKVFIFVRQPEERRQAATRPKLILSQPRSKFPGGQNAGKSRVRTARSRTLFNMTRAAASRFALFGSPCHRRAAAPSPSCISHQSSAECLSVAQPLRNKMHGQINFRILASYVGLHFLLLHLRGCHRGW